MIRIASSHINVNARAMEIYVSGCRRNCEGCHNSELQDFNYGTEWKEWWPKQIPKTKNPLIQRIWILGGDALCQSVNDFIPMMEDIYKEGKELWLWTGADKHIIPPMYQIKKYFSYLKVGPYDCTNKHPVKYKIEGQYPYNLKLIGDNQKLYRLEGEEWKEVEKCS